MSRILRLLELAVVAVLVAAVVCLFVVDRTPRALVVDSSAREGWQTIEYEGVRVDIPEDWKRTDPDDCEFAFEHWGPTVVTGCGDGVGVSFYRSATFDPAHGPGLRRAARNSDDPAWGGYVYAGDYAVYVAGPDRDLVGETLDTARPPRKD